jgi:hypothetical protein
MELTCDLLRPITLQLPKREDIRLPPACRLFENNISEFPGDDELPDFIMQLDQELCLWRSRGHVSLAV